MEGKPDLDGSKHSEEMRTSEQVHAGWRAFDSTETDRCPHGVQIVTQKHQKILGISKHKQS